MDGLRYAGIDLGLRLIARGGLDRLLSGLTRGRGAILTLHRVGDVSSSLLPENAGLTVSPAFLDASLREIRRLGYDIIALDSVPERLATPAARPFVVLTFDDGYRDLRDAALPVLKAHEAPFTAFICTGFADRSAPLWWLDIEAAVRRLEHISLHLPTGTFNEMTHGKAEKRDALRALYWRLRALDEAGLRAAHAHLCDKAEVDPAAHVGALCMDWEELAAFANEPLASIGAHSQTHARLARVSEDQARAEMQGSMEAIATRLGRPVRHFCYPVGDKASADGREAQLAREAGFATACTTRPGVLNAGENLHLLPRISLNGLFQRVEVLRVLLSGLPFWRPWR